MFYVVEVDNDGFKVYDSAGTLIDPAKEGTLADVRTILTAIRDTAGIKKITDALPTGDNWVGRFKLGDGTNLIAVPTHGTDIASAYGIPILGRDAQNLARFLFTEADGTLRVASQPPSPPPGTTEFVLAIDEAELEVGAPPTYHETVSPAVADGDDLFLQIYTAGAAGDPSERGSRVDLIWRAGATPVDHIIERMYVSGQSVTVALPDVNKARDGTLMTGDGTNNKLVIRRYRLSNAGAEVDAIVRGYTQ